MGMQNSKYLVAGYPFEGNANDIKGVNNGTVNGATFVDGQIGRALSFDGVDDYVVIPDNNSLSFTDGTNDKPFSISMRLKIPNVTVNRFIIHKRTAQFEWQTGIDSSKIFMSMGDNGGTSVYSGRYSLSPLTSNIWQHCVFTYNGSGGGNGINIYINGVLSNGTIYTIGTYSHMINTTSPVMVAKADFATTYFKGIIDNIKIYNKALTQQEIQRDYLNLPIL